MDSSRIRKIPVIVVMGFFMVYGMEAYNAFLRDRAFALPCLLVPARDFLVLVPCVLLFQFFVGAPVAALLARWLVGPRVPAALRRFLLTPLFTVATMCPLMSLVATFLFKDFTGRFLATWMATVSVNLPMAICWQVLFAGPIVRSIFSIPRLAKAVS